MRNSSNILTSKVNFIVGVVFLGSFTVFAMNIILDAADMNNPITNVTASALGIHADE